MSAKYFSVAASALTALRKLRDRLYSEERMSAEEMRDRAQWLDSFLESMVQEDSEQRLSLKDAIHQIDVLRRRLLCDTEENEFKHPHQAIHLDLALNHLASARSFLKLADPE